MTDLRSELEDALDEFDKSGAPGVPKATRLGKAVLLAEAVRSFLDDADLDDTANPYYFGKTIPPPSRPPPRHPNSAVDLGLTVTRSRPVTIDGIVYNTAMNAFQAHKADPSERHRFALVEYFDAVQMGRSCVIDCAAWDAGRKTLMTKILRTQASQNPEFAKLIVDHGATVLEDSMQDMYWPHALPQIWAELASELASQSSSVTASGDDDTASSSSVDQKSDQKSGRKRIMESAAKEANPSKKKK